MPDNQSLLADPKVWISALALLVSCCSALIALRSLRNSTRALAISESQDKRRQPQLGIYLINGYRRLMPKGQVFGFLVSVTNPTDINNSIARAELQIKYVPESGVETICRINHNPDLVEKAANDGRSATILSLPMRIDAHQTVSGWFLFLLETGVIQNGTVDAHSLILEDTHGVSTNTDPIMVKEWRDEIQKGREISSPSS